MAPGSMLQSRGTPGTRSISLKTWVRVRVRVRVREN